MNIDSTHCESESVTQDILLTVVRELIYGRQGREDDEHPAPPGPWDPVIRDALNPLLAFGASPDPWRLHSPGTQPWRIVPSVSGPHPDPWRPGPIPWRPLELHSGLLPGPWKSIFASIAARYPAIWDLLGGPAPWGAEVALNPQPLPPRQAFLLSLAETVLSRALLLQDLARTRQGDGPVDAPSAAARYLALFADDICGNDFRLRWPFPGPRPHWFLNELRGIDLILLAVGFAQAAEDTAGAGVRQAITAATERLVQVGGSRMAGNEASQKQGVS